MVFLDKKQRQEMTNRLSAVTNRSAPDQITPGLAKSPFMGKLSGKVVSVLSARGVSGAGQDDLERACRRWQSREISNVRDFRHAPCLWAHCSLAHLPEYSKPNIRSHTKRRNAVSRLPWVTVSIPTILSNPDHIAWVLNDYSSSTLDLTTKGAFRE